MKFGIRTPSIKKSISARTKGRITRTVRKATSIGYGKKGMGYIKNPSRAIYNKIYHKTTVGVSDIFSSSSTRNNKSIGQRNGTSSDYSWRNSYDVTNDAFESIPPNRTMHEEPSYMQYSCKKWTAFFLCLFFGFFGVHKLYEKKFGAGLLYLSTVGLFSIGWIVDLVTILKQPKIYRVYVKKHSIRFYQLTGMGFGIMLGGVISEIIGISTGSVNVDNPEKVFIFIFFGVGLGMIAGYILGSENAKRILKES